MSWNKGVFVIDTGVLFEYNTKIHRFYLSFDLWDVTRKTPNIPTISVFFSNFLVCQ